MLIRYSLNIYFSMGLEQTQAMKAGPGVYTFHLNGNKRRMLGFPRNKHFIGMRGTKIGTGISATVHGDMPRQAALLDRVV
jgi:hypothetical protein